MVGKMVDKHVTLVTLIDGSTGKPITEPIRVTSFGAINLPDWDIEVET
jgi:hypothetical protein